MSKTKKILSEFTLVSLAENRAVGICMLDGESAKRFYKHLPLDSDKSRTRAEREAFEKQYGVQIVQEVKEKGVLDSNWIRIEIADLELFLQKTETKKKLKKIMSIAESDVLTPPNSSNERVCYFGKKKDAVLVWEACSILHATTSEKPINRITINGEIRFCVVINEALVEERTSAAKSPSQGLVEISPAHKTRTANRPGNLF